MEATVTVCGTVLFLGLRSTLGGRPMAWTPGEAVVLREGPWLGATGIVVRDEPDALVTYTPEGAPFGFPPGPWPTPDGRHPWYGRSGWKGHGMLAVQRPGQAHAVCHFWWGEERRFAGWYLNLQKPFVRTSIGFDTQDLELDIWVRLDGSWSFKDRELMPQRVVEGRWTEEEVAEICAEGDRLGARLDRGERWWDEAWASWSPDPGWGPTPLPEGWEKT